MAANYVLLASQTVGAAGASSVTFSNIPQTGYTDLKVVASIRPVGAGGFGAGIYFNNDQTSTRYTTRALRGDATSAISFVGGATTYSYLGEHSSNTASTFGNVECYIPNYAGSNQKSFSIDAVGEKNTVEAYQVFNAGLYNQTTAISQITIYVVTSNIAQYSSFYLYGLAASGVTPVIAPFATGGNVTNDGTYWIHTFLASGTFTPLKALSCNYLVVAGGGGASRLTGAGAGGLRCTVTATGGGGSLETALSLTAQAYTVTIGGGGAKDTSGGVSAATNGVNSVFSTITSTGGGAVGADNATGNSGGSGGGGYYPGVGGAGTANQGYAGGTAGASGNISPYPQGGGGGAGQIGGTNGLCTGGNGVATSITGSSVTYAGGGAGSNVNATAYAGGTGGAVNSGTSGANGTANTGSGGSANGGGSYNLAGNGGSGIVIVRYAMV